ncbi:MAG: hypothetical protein QOI07_1979 [Verrucomicrobiota bacterium]|jgi:hypothetical protein
MKNIRLLRLLAFPLLCVILAFSFAPALRAEVPPDQVKAAAAIPLTKELFDKMEKFNKAMETNTEAKAELATASKDPSISPDNWGSAITAKCPKVTAVFKSVSLSADDFGKAIFAIMALAMGEELAKSEDKAVKANYDFIKANEAQANTIFGSFMMLGDTSSSSPAATP